MVEPGVPRVLHAVSRRLRTAAAVGLLVLLLGGVPATGLVPPGGLSPAGVARADVTTVSVDNLRTGWDRDEPGLSPGSVSSPDFGRLFSTAVDGQVYAQPLVAGGTLVVATETNNVYGLSPATGQVRWQRNVGRAWPAAVSGCGDLTPSIGITSTPVYDPATRSVLFVAKVDDGPNPDLPSIRMHAVDAATGVERPGFPRTIGGAPSNDPAHPFTARNAMQRPGLLLLDGVVYAAFGSLCDVGPFVGYVAGVSAATGRQTALWSAEAGSSWAQAGIWQSGGGLVSDGPGRILLATGTGVSPPPGPGTSPPGTLAESVVRLDVGADGSLTARDYFSPYDNTGLDQDDTDLGSGGPMGLPNGFGPPGRRDLLVQSGKDGRVYLLDRADLGGTAQGAGGRDRVVSVSGPYNGQWNHPAFYGGDGGYVYIAEGLGYLRAHKYGVTAAGAPTLASVATSTAALPFGSGSPVVTSTGTTPGSALVWMVRLAPSAAEQAELRAYDAVPSAGVLRLRWSAPIGTGAKFTVPATDAGRVFVGTRDGHVVGFGRPTTSPLSGSPADFGQVEVGSTGQRALTLTATRPLTVTALAAAPPFTVSPVPLPGVLAAGQSLAVPLSFAPRAPGAASGTLTVTTSAGDTAVDLHGTGTAPGLASNPAAAAFGTVPTGGQKDLTVNIVNTGTTAETLTGVTLPRAPFHVDAAPAAGAPIAPGASVAVSISYRPTIGAQDRDTLTVFGSDGSVSVPLSGTAVTGAAHLSVPATLDFGEVPLDTSVTRTFDVANTGNVGLTVSKAAPPAGVFGTDSPLQEGQLLSPGDVYHQPVTFRPVTAGAASGSYQITGTDGRGAQVVRMTGTGVGDPISVKRAELRAAGIYVGDPLRLPFDLPGGRGQDFRWGSIYWSPGTGAHMVRGAIKERYLGLGGPGGWLGYPVTDESATPDNTGSYNHFAAAASIYYTPATGAREIHGAIRGEWAATGWERGPLGYPATDELVTPDGIGRYTQFGFGSVYWTPATGAHEVHGAIRDEWAATGWERGPLGYPVTGELGTPDGTGRYGHFAAGSVYWTARTGAHEVHGAIRERWAALGWERSSLGYPTTDEYAVPGGRRTDFAHGSLTWDAATGLVR